MGCSQCSQQAATAGAESEANLTRAANVTETFTEAPKPQEDFYVKSVEVSEAVRLLPTPSEARASNTSPSGLPVYTFLDDHVAASQLSMEEDNELEALRIRLKELALDPDSGPWLEGELLKYKPAGEERFVRRWAVLTRSHFQYYKNQVSPLMGDRPLMTLALNKLVSVLVYLLSRSKDSRFKLELITNEMVDPAERSGREVVTHQKHLLPKPKYLPGGSPNRSPMTQSSGSGGAVSPAHVTSLRSKGFTNGRATWTARENEMYKAETRLLFACDSFYELQRWKLALEAVSLD